MWETTWDPDPTLPGSTADRFAGTVWETDDYLFGNVERAGEGEQFVALFRWGNFQEQHPNCFDGEGRQRWNGQPTTGYR